MENNIITSYLEHEKENTADNDEDKEWNQLEEFFSEKKNLNLGRTAKNQSPIKAEETNPSSVEEKIEETDPSPMEEKIQETNLSSVE